MPKTVLVTATSSFKLKYLIEVPNDCTRKQIEEFINSDDPNIVECSQDHLGEVIQTVKEIDEESISQYIDPMYQGWDKETMDRVLVNKITDSQ